MALIGIDLGTTYSAVATLDETGRPVIVGDSSEGSYLTPSVVQFLSAKKSLVGVQAEQVLGNDPNTFGRFKRSMGEEKKYEAFGVKHTPTSLSALVLKYLKESAEKRLGEEIDEAVVSVPANFANEAREATLEAANKAGLNIKHIINEPTAAALFYASSSKKGLSGTFAVYDFGGGTFDISIIKVEGKEIEVIATDGSDLGGDDFDDKLLELIKQKYKDETGKTPETEDFGKRDAEFEKRSLSKRDSVKARVRSTGGRKSIEISRKEFEEAISTLVSSSEMLVEAALEQAKLKPEDIDEVIMVGGSTRVPAIQESAKRVFKKEPETFINPDEAIALGAALFAAKKADPKNLNALQQKAVDQIKVQEITGKCYGTISVTQDDEEGRYVKQNSIIISRGMQIPCSKTEDFYTTSEGQTKLSCTITETKEPITDPGLVTILWEGDLDLPSGRPSGQRIDITFSYTGNQTMECSFKDVESGKVKETEINISSESKSDEVDIEEFLVE